MGKDFLRCDAAGCDHVEMVGTITGDMVGMPCPACGANLLTEQDWKQWASFVAVLNAVQALIPEGSGGAPIKTSVHIHEGKVTMTAEPASETTPDS